MSVGRKPTCCIECAVHTFLHPYTEPKPCAILYYEGSVQLSDIIRPLPEDALDAKDCEACGHKTNWHIDVCIRKQPNRSVHFNVDAILEQIFPKKHPPPTVGSLTTSVNLRYPPLFSAPLPRILSHMIRSGHLKSVLDELSIYPDTQPTENDEIHFSQVILFRRLRNWLYPQSKMSHSDGSIPIVRKLTRSSTGLLATMLSGNEIGFSYNLLQETNCQIAEMLVARAVNSNPVFSNEELQNLQDLRQHYRQGRRLNGIKTSEYSMADSVGWLNLENRGQVGRGKFGKVYKVSYGEFIMALKVVDPACRRDIYDEELLRSEVKLAVGFQFTTFLQVFSVAPWMAHVAKAIYSMVTRFWLEEEKLCLLMPLFQATLNDYLERRRLPSEFSNARKLFHRLEAAYIVHQILDCLKSLHFGGVCHGDLHLKNILIDKRGGELDAVVTDFGLSRQEGRLMGSNPSSEPEDGSSIPFGGISRFKDLYSVANIYERLLWPLQTSQLVGPSQTPTNDANETAFSAQRTHNEESVRVWSQLIEAVNEPLIILKLKRADMPNEDFTAEQASGCSLAMVVQLYLQLRRCNEGEAYLRRIPPSLVVKLLSLDEKNDFIADRQHLVEIADFVIREQSKS